MKIKLILVLLATFIMMSCSMVLLGFSAQMPDLSAKADGMYQGNSFNVWVDVTLENHRITKIDITEHYHSPVGKNAEKIIDKIIQKQSLDVDVVTGATMSSQSILKAVENALQ